MRLAPRHAHDLHPLPVGHAAANVIKRSPAFPLPKSTSASASLTRYSVRPRLRRLRLRRRVPRHLGRLRICRRRLGRLRLGRHGHRRPDRRVCRVCRVHRVRPPVRRVGLRRVETVAEAKPENAIASMNLVVGLRRVIMLVPRVRVRGPFFLMWFNLPRVSDIKKRTS